LDGTKFSFQFPAFAEEILGVKDEISDSTVIKITEAARTIKPAAVKISIKGKEENFFLDDVIYLSTLK